MGPSDHHFFGHGVRESFPHSGPVWQRGCARRRQSQRVPGWEWGNLFEFGGSFFGPLGPSSGRRSKISIFKFGVTRGKVVKCL